MPRVFYGHLPQLPELSALSVIYHHTAGSVQIDTEPFNVLFGGEVGRICWGRVPGTTEWGVRLPLNDWLVSTFDGQTVLMAPVDSDT